MNKYDILPKGYYYVGNKIDGVVEFKGKKYAVQENINFFSTFSDAVINATVVPETVIDGVIGEYVGAPVILMGAGEHEIEEVDLKKSLYILGDNAKLIGPFWYGCIKLRDGCDKLTVDNFTFENIRIHDYRKDRGDRYLTVKNVEYTGMNPWYSFLCAPKSLDCKQHYLIENIRADGIDGFGYGFEFMRIAPAFLSINNLIYKNTDKPFGFSSFDKKFANVTSDFSARYSVKNTVFSDNFWQKGFTFNAAGDIVADFTDCKFVGCTENDDARELFDVVATENSVLSFKNCVFSSKKSKMLVAGRLKPENLRFSDCDVNGFVKAKNDSFLFDEKGLTAAFIESELFGITDPHNSVDADFSALNDYYTDRIPFYCDMHSHSNSGGTSDGLVDLSEWPKEMAEKHVDFVAIADHRQMRHFFLPEFDDSKFFYANEPEALIEGGNVKFDKLHYNMICPDKYLLGKMLARFSDKYDFRGDELTGSFEYKNFTHNELSEVAKFITDNGGMFVHAHPMAMLVSSDVNDYCFGDKTYIEVFSNDYTSILAFNDWKLWTRLLALGKKVYNISGSDSHTHCNNSCVCVVYAEKRHNRSLFPYFKAGDFSSGAFGIKMMLGYTPMGGTAELKDDDKLLVEIDDLFDIYRNNDKKFLVKIISDKGVAYSCIYDGKEKLRISLVAKKRKFYRVEIIDTEYRTPFALSNPIWIK